MWKNTKKTILILLVTSLLAIAAVSLLGGSVFAADKYYTVKFDTRGGSSVPSQKVKEGEYAKEPAKPTKDRWTFYKWYANPANKDDYFSFSDTPITSDITLHARWEAKIFICVYDAVTEKAAANGGGRVSTHGGTPQAAAIDSSYCDGQDVHLKAAPFDGNRFLRWVEMPSYNTYYPNIKDDFVFFSSDPELFFEIRGEATYYALFAEEGKIVDIPTGTSNEYTGNEITGLLPGEHYTLSGTVSATDVGTHEAVATLEEGYVWEDGLKDDKIIKWEITPIEIKPVLTLSNTSYKYDGKVKTPDVKVQYGSKVFIKDENYEVIYAAGRKNAGKYKVTIKMKGELSGKAEAYFTISKAANPLRIKAKTAQLKFKALKKKTRTLPVTKVIAITKKGQGTMTYTKASGNNKITVNKKTGKVTVKKGLNKGTYKIKVKVKALGNKNYKPSSVKTVTFKIKVK